MPAQNTQNSEWKTAHTEISPPAQPRKAPSTKPARRPMRCISWAANQVTTAPATVISAKGRVAKALSGASMWPVSAVRVRSMEMAAVNSPWQMASTQALRRPWGDSVGP